MEVALPLSWCLEKEDRDVELVEEQEFVLRANAIVVNVYCPLQHATWLDNSLETEIEDLRQNAIVSLDQRWLEVISEARAHPGAASYCLCWEEVSPPEHGIGKSLHVTGGVLRAPRSLPSTAISTSQMAAMTASAYCTIFETE